MGKLVLLVLVALALPVSAASRYVRERAGANGLIVFVHGVTGNATSTWTNAKTSAYWPQLVADDPAFADEDVFVYEYPSPKLATAFNINELAEDLRLTLAGPLAAHKRVTFLAHSMGGLVVRQYLIKYRESAEQVGLIYFYSTPTTGSPMAVLTSIFSRNPQLGDLRPMKSDEYLANLQRDWLASAKLRELPAFCAYETLPLITSRVVEQESASNLCNRPLDPINANHVDIVKPESRDDKPYRTFAAAYATLRSPARSGTLRAEIQNATQLIGLRESQPQTQIKEPIYCDSMKLSLVLANPEKAGAPVLINAIGVEVTPLDAAQVVPGLQCKVDRFDSHPHGIVERNTYMMQIVDAGVRGKLLKDATTSVPVQSQNILVAGANTRAISLRPGEEPVGLDFQLQSTARQPQQITFTISYDQDGEKKLTTRRVLLWK